MPLIRILVDGYSLLHAWPELARESARHSARAREALIATLGEYQAALGTPITVFFDGQSGGLGARSQKTDPREIEVLYSKANKTADDLIERAAYRFKAYGEVLVITDDNAERDTVQGFGALASSCATFIAQLEGESKQAHLDLKAHNRRERDRFQRDRSR
ncbi:MAG: NYN domain-containing protein [Verrucomicrobia bacterium]|nr:NYN domain-containing protein [Verrucomicrobiota bacterium]